MLEASTFYVEVGITHNIKQKTVCWKIEWLFFHDYVMREEYARTADYSQTLNWRSQKICTAVALEKDAKIRFKTERTGNSATTERSDYIKMERVGSSVETERTESVETDNY